MPAPKPLDIIAPRDLFTVAEPEIRRVRVIRDDGDSTSVLPDQSLAAISDAVASYQAEPTEAARAVLGDAFAVGFLAIGQINRRPWPKQLQWVCRQDFPGNFSQLRLDAIAGIEDGASQNEAQLLATIAVMAIRFEGVLDPDTGASGFVIRGETLKERMREVARVPEPYWKYAAGKLVEAWVTDPLGLGVGATNGNSTPASSTMQPAS